MTHSPASAFAQSFAKIDLFRDIGSDAAKLILLRCKWRNYEPGEIIVDYLDRTDDVFFLTDGEARTNLYSADGRAVTFSDLQAGEQFGEIAAIDGGPRSASIEARTRCSIASMSRSSFLETLEAEPAIALKLLKTFASRIRTLTTRVYEFSALDVANRTRAELLRLARLAPRTGKAATISPIPTHADIASRISTHREAVTRELNALSKLGLVERHGNVLVVNDVERLALLVSKATGE